MAEQNINQENFLKAFDQEASEKTETQQNDSTSSFLKAFDSFDEIDLSKSALDLSLEDRFTRNKALQELYSNDQISSSTYYNKLEPLTAEEAAYLESQERGEPVDPDTIKESPYLIAKYGVGGVEVNPQFVKDIKVLEDAGVDILSGAPPSIRYDIGRQTDDEMKQKALDLMIENGSVLNYQPTKFGYVLDIPSEEGTKQVLLDEIGFTGKDFLDFTSEIPGMASYIAAAAAAAPLAYGGGILSMGILPVIAGMAYFTGSSVSDVVNRMSIGGDITFDTLIEIAKTRGVETAIGVGLDTLFVGGGKLIKGIGQTAVGPFAKGGDKALKAKLDEIVKNRQVIQYDNKGNMIMETVEVNGEKILQPKYGPLQLPVGTKTQSPTLKRIEAIAEKIPGGAEVFAIQKDILEKQLIQLEKQALGVQPIVEVVDDVPRLVYPDVPLKQDVGKQVLDFASNEINNQQQAILALRKELIGDIETDLSLAAQEIAGTPSTEFVLTTREVGTKVQGAVEGYRKDVIDETRKAFDNIKKAEGYDSSAVVEVDNLRDLVETVERKLPTTTRQVKQGKEMVDVTEEIYPKGLKQAFDDIQNLDEMTLEQALNYKNILNDALSSGQIIANQSEALIMPIIKQLDENIEAAIAGMGPDVNRAYDIAMLSAKNKNEILNNQNIKNILSSDKPELIAVKNVLENDFSTIEVLQQALGKDAPIFNDIKAATLNELFQKSRSSLDLNHLNPGKLLNMIDNMSDEMAQFVFGEKKKNVVNALQAYAFERGTIPDNLLAEYSGNFSEKLKKIKLQEDIAADEWQKEWLTPFLKGDITKVTKENVIDFTNKFLKTASADEITTFMNKLPPKLQELMKTRVVQDVIEAGRTADPDLFLKAVVETEDQASPELFNVLVNAYGGGSAGDAKKKLTAIFGEETFDLLTDVGIIQLAKKETAKEASTAGGLVSGSILNNILNLKFGAVPQLLKYRLVSKLVTSDVGKKWLTSTAKIPDSRIWDVGVILPDEVIEVITQDIREDDPAQADQLRDLLEKSNEDVKRKEQNLDKQLQSKAEIPMEEMVAQAEQVPVQIPTTAVPGSAVSSAQVVAPLPTMGGAGQPVNVARAQQAFPFDPIFAAAEGGSANKQGIMNTSRGRQMVV
jgi:hypothetical protein